MIQNISLPSPSLTFYVVKTLEHKRKCSIIIFKTDVSKFSFLIEIVTFFFFFKVCLSGTTLLFLELQIQTNLPTSASQCLSHKFGYNPIYSGQSSIPHTLQGRKSPKNIQNVMSPKSNMSLCFVGKYWSHLQSTKAEELRRHDRYAFAGTVTCSHHLRDFHAVLE